MYSSRATELGRGQKTQKLSDAPEWTPAPNAYTMKTDFINQTAIESAKNPNLTKPAPVLDENGEIME